jgi:hypothetical protein
MAGDGINDAPAEAATSLNSISAISDALRLRNVRLYSGAYRVSI